LRHWLLDTAWIGFAYRTERLRDSTCKPKLPKPNGKFEKRRAQPYRPATRPTRDEATSSPALVSEVSSPDYCWARIRPESDWAQPVSTGRTKLCSHLQSGPQNEFGTADVIFAAAKIFSVEALRYEPSERETNRVFSDLLEQGTDRRSPRDCDISFATTRDLDLYCPQRRHPSSPTLIPDLVPNASGPAERRRNSVAANPRSQRVRSSGSRRWI